MERDDVRIPKDPEARARLAEFAGLTAEERLALDLWCAEQQRENDARPDGRSGPAPGRRQLMALGLFLFFAIATTLTDGDGGWAVPVGDDGRPCPLPFDPLFLFGEPIGMYHCPFCGSMILAGVPHVDYAAALAPQVEERPQPESDKT